MNDISAMRYETLKSKGVYDCTIKDMIRIYGVESIEKGYTICVSDYSDSTIPNAYCIQRIDEVPVFDSDWDACRSAEKDGIKFINDVDGLEKGYYIDTVENRQICLHELSLHPELRVENWIEYDDEWGFRYREYISLL